MKLEKKFDFQISLLATFLKGLPIQYAPDVTRLDSATMLMLPDGMGKALQTFNKCLFKSYLFS
ncbi:Uncharacterised protein [Chlamydia trachomatis]|nr:Uncharacterised protein [Chlamydia trachomatis]CRH65512.1 Uncharacterised protein [Chlamydia trachomatis]CRI74042.1 Uncharacterised protein [Chlamydia trachomatis]